MQLGRGFWASKTLLSAVEIGLFGELAGGPLTAADLRHRLHLHDRGARDFLDALVALGMLERNDGAYANTPETDLFLDRGKPSYVGGMLEMANARLYPFWGSLTEALNTGLPQNESKGGGADVFGALYATPDRLRQFLQSMTGISLGLAMALAQRFPWDGYRTFLDVGTAQGALPVEIARAHPHLTGAGFDLPPVGPIFDEYVAAASLAYRVRFHAGDFFADPLPSADVLVMGHILHDWGRAEQQTLIEKAYAALPTGGALIVHDPIIDEDRRENVFGFLMSPNMLIETPQGAEYTAAECAGWLRQAGFNETRIEPLAGPESMVIGTSSPSAAASWRSSRRHGSRAAGIRSPPPATDPYDRGS